MVKKKALVATMGKLTRLIYHCLKNNELYEYTGGVLNDANKSNTDSLDTQGLSALPGRYVFRLRQMEMLTVWLLRFLKSKS